MVSCLVIGVWFIVDGVWFWFCVFWVFGFGDWFTWFSFAWFCVGWYFGYLLVSGCWFVLIVGLVVLDV